MRRNIRKELLARFRQELTQRLPQFRRQTGKTDSPVWAFGLSPKLTFLVKLQPLPKDEFVLEIAWSDDGQFPFQTWYSYPPKVHDAKWRERLARFWSKGALEETWAVVPPETPEE